MSSKPHHWHDKDDEEGKDFHATSATVYGSQPVHHAINVRATGYSPGTSQRPLGAFTRLGKPIRRRPNRVTTRSMGAVRPYKTAPNFRF